MRCKLGLFSVGFYERVTSVAPGGSAYLSRPGVLNLDVLDLKGGRPHFSSQGSSGALPSPGDFHTQHLK